MALALGLPLSVLLLWAWLGFRPLGAALYLPSFWVKATYTGLLLLAGWIMTLRIARPDGTLGAGLAVFLLGLAGMASLAIGQSMAADPDARALLWFGSSWKACPIRIVALATPILGVVLLALRGLAPTRLVVAGASAGLLAGGAAATIYGLHCEETSAAFVSAWYSLGVLLTAALGAALGPRCLRW